MLAVSVRADGFVCGVCVAVALPEKMKLSADFFFLQNRKTLQNSFSSILPLSRLVNLCAVTQEVSCREWRQTHGEAFLGIDAHFFFLFFFFFTFSCQTTYCLSPLDSESLVNRSSMKVA